MGTGSAIVVEGSQRPEAAVPAAPRPGGAGVVAIVTTHIAPAQGYGGIAESTARIAARWAATGRRIALCSSDTSTGGRLRREDIALPRHVPVRLFGARLWPAWGLGLGAPLAVLRTCLGADRAYISGVGTWPCSLAALACLLLGRPYVVSVRGGLMPGHVDHIRRHKPHKWLFYRLITLPTVARARAVHATSAIEAEGVRAMVPGARVAVLANPIDLAAWPEMPPRPPDGGLVLAYVGRLSPEKGLLPFLRVWCGARGPRDRLLIAGSGGGAHAEEIRALAAASGGGVEMLGYLPADGVRRVLARADMLVLPSAMGSGGLRENFGNAVVEAMASGRPVLVTAGMAWDGVEADGAGLVFAPHPEAARAALARAAALSPQDRAAMGRAARRLAEERFALAPLTDRLWDLLDGPA